MTGPEALDGLAPDPKAGRYRPLGRALVVMLWLVGLSALAAVVLPHDAADVLATLTVALLLAAPVLRVVWLGVRWLRRGDLRFALVAGGVLAVVALGVVLAAL